MEEERLQLSSVQGHFDGTKQRMEINIKGEREREREIEIDQGAPVCFQSVAAAVEAMCLFSCCH